jgi:hypothetical protein
MAARRTGAGEWIVRIGLLVLVGVVVWLALDRLPFSPTVEDRPIIYEHEGYEGQPDSPLSGSQVNALRERARGQALR